MKVSDVKTEGTELLKEGVLESKVLTCKSEFCYKVNNNEAYDRMHTENVFARSIRTGNWYSVYWCTILQLVIIRLVIVRYNLYLIMLEQSVKS